ncbi:hypothetical protein ACWDTB_34985, partial [Streptomyces sp. NPDC003487]
GRARPARGRGGAHTRAARVRRAAAACRGRRAGQVAEYVARHAASRETDPEDPDMPSEFPERWSRFLPPEDVTGRLRAHAKSTHKSNGEPGDSPEK